MSNADHPTGGSRVSPRSKASSLAACSLGLIVSLLPLTSRAADPETAPLPPAAESEPLAAWNARWQTLLGQLRPYDIPILDEISAAPTPTTLEELTQRVDQVYVETAFQSAQRYWTYEKNLRAVTDERVRLEEARVDHAKSEKELAAAPDHLKQEEARSAALTAQAANEERIAANLRENAAGLEQDFLAIRGSTLGSVYYLLPTNQRVSFHEGTQKNANNPIYAVLPEVEPDSAAQAKPAPASPGASKKESTGPVQPPPVAGTLEEKFAAFEDKQRALRSLAALLPPQEKQLATARELADAQAKQNEILKSQLAEFAPALARSAAAASEAEDRILTAQVNQKISAGNLLRMGTAAILWSYLKETIAAPQMENFLQDNGIAKKSKGPALLDEINQRPQDFIPRKGAFENSQPLSALRLKLLDVEPSLDVRAPAAAEALEAGKISGSAEIAARFFKNLDQQGVAVLRATTDTLVPPQKRIATALLAKAPAE